ncbi:MAG: alpha/beta hydrolase [Bradyrhizobium sp.]|nr:alpha/beta hydrolase [Bradyrhizobium sp.]
MQTIKVNGYDMAYLEIGKGAPLVLVHGTLGDFRTWNSVMGPLSRTHRVISVSLRWFFPEHWDGAGDDYKMAQHISDVVAFIEQIAPGPIDLVGHSRGGHIAFRIAEQRPDLLRKIVLAEPGGQLDASLIPPGAPPAPPMPLSVAMPAVLGSIRGGDVDGALRTFVDAIDGDGAWARLPAAAKQQLRDNVFTLLGQAGEGRKPFTRAQAESIRTPTLFIGGGNTTGSLAAVHRALARHVADARTEMIEGARHWMFDAAPQEFSEAVTAFLAG